MPYLNFDPDDESDIRNQRDYKAFTREILAILPVWDPDIDGFQGKTLREIRELLEKQKTSKQPEPWMIRLALDTLNAKRKIVQDSNLLIPRYCRVTARAPAPDVADKTYGWR